MTPDPAAVGVQIQTVLFRNANADVWRLLFGVAGTVAFARRAGHLGEARWVLGDCSPDAVLPEQEVRELEATARAEGLDGYSYEFFDANLGSSGGHNRLAAGGWGDVLVTLNPDTYPSPRMLDELLGALQAPGVGIAEARQLPMEHPKRYSLADGATSWASTCAIAVPRAVFDGVDGFDHDHFPLYCDDVDFSWRVRYAGHECVVAPRATVFHDKRPSSGGVQIASDVEVFHSTLGRLMLAARWDRPDIHDETVRWVEGHGSEPQQRALAEYRARAAEGRVPTPLHDAAKVAQFVQGEYAEHRF